MVFAMLHLSISCTSKKTWVYEDLSKELTKQEFVSAQNQLKYITIKSGGITETVQIDEINTIENYFLCKIIQPTQPNSKDKISNQKTKIKEVQIFATNIALNDSIIKVPFGSVSRVAITESTGSSAGKTILAVVGIAAAVFVLALVIIALTKSSCPYVYVYEDGSYQFKGEIFGGAIFLPLEREDYLTLLENVDLHQNGEIKIQIANELLEKQYTNLAEVIVVEHEPNAKTRIASNGQILLVGDPIPPITATLNGIIDISKQIASSDSLVCYFDQANLQNKAQLDLKFVKPHNAAQANLLLTAKNSLWLDYTFGKFTSLFGSYYNQWIVKQRHANKDSLQQWTRQQQLPLKIELKIDNRWTVVDEIPTIGPLANRDMCVPLNLSGLYSDTLEVRLSCGFMFWEVDQVAIDFTPQTALRTFTLKPTSAVNENNKDVLANLMWDDNYYLSQPKPGNVATIKYLCKNGKSDKKYDVYLHGKGYYEHVREYSGMPDIAYLKSFKQPGSFTNFSRQLYDRYLNEMGPIVAK